MSALIDGRIDVFIEVLANALKEVRKHSSLFETQVAGAILSTRIK